MIDRFAYSASERVKLVKSLGVTKETATQKIHEANERDLQMSREFWKEFNGSEPPNGWEERVLNWESPNPANPFQDANATAEHD